MEEQLNLLHKVNEGQRAESLVCQYVDFLLTTGNPCTPDQGWSKPYSHPCQTIYLSLKEKQMEHDYVNLLNSVQTHTTCSTKYCLREKDKSDLLCRFNFPFDDCASTRINFESILTKNSETKYKATFIIKWNEIWVLVSAKGI